jgi:hypothetical protein
MVIDKLRIILFDDVTNGVDLFAFLRFCMLTLGAFIVSKKSFYVPSNGLIQKKKMSKRQMMNKNDTNKREVFR